MKNRSLLPTHMQYLIKNRFFPVSFSQDNIVKIVQNLGSSKAYGQDNICIGMIKVCGPAIFKPLTKILKHCLNTDLFSCEW